MTKEQIKDEKFKAWERLEQAREEHHAISSRMEGWVRPFQVVGQRLEAQNFAALEHDIAKLPSREELLASIEEFKISAKNLERAIEYAKRFNWPIG